MILIFKKLVYCFFWCIQNRCIV